jgi:hypothetical protein
MTKQFVAPMRVEPLQSFPKIDQCHDPTRLSRNDVEQKGQMQRHHVEMPHVLLHDGELGVGEDRDLGTNRVTLAAKVHVVDALISRIRVWSF